MPQILKSKKVPYSPAQMFDLVADVERYPDFLPWCYAAQLDKRDDKEIIGTLTVEKGGLRKSFTTRNTYRYPNYMDIVMINGPFKRLDGQWTFIEQPDGGCVVNYQMRLEVPFFLMPLLGGLMDFMGNKMVDAFVKRANEIYGK